MVLDLDAFASRLGLQTHLQLASDNTPVLNTGEEETLSAAFSCVQCAVGDEAESLGPGTLFVTTRRVVWVGNEQPASSLSLRYNQIAMHAVSKDPEAHARPCVYLQLDEGSEAGDEDEDEELPSAEIRFVPDAAEAVEDIFKKLCECSALNPDTDNEDEGQAELFFDEAEALAGLSPEQRAAVLAARTEDALGIEEGQEGQDELLELMADDPSRFEDDEDEDEQQPDGHATKAGNGYRQ